MAGWLGPWKSAKELLQQAFSESGLACHMQLHKAHEEGGAPFCTGALVCANKSFKLYRNDEIRVLQEKTVDSDEILDAREFLEHHKNRLALIGGEIRVGSNEEV
jgi:hypothetical protein